MPAPLLFTNEEHATRIKRVRDKCLENNLDALLAVGRGGGPVDRYSHVFYLTEAYASFPTIPDLPGHWTDRGWCAALITNDTVTVFSDPETAVPDAVYADDVRAGYFLFDMIIDVLKSLDKSYTRIGIAGADTLTLRQARTIHSALSDLQIVDADEVMYQVRAIKSAAEIEIMRDAGKIAQSTIAAAMEAARPGASEADAAAAAVQRIAQSGAVLANAFTGVSPGSSHITYPHIQFPPYSKESIIHSGDMFLIDISASLNGYFFDLARTKVVDSEPTREQSNLIELAKHTVDTVANTLMPGTTIANATHAGLNALRGKDYDITTDSGWQALGHGLGLGFEPPYFVTSCNDVVRPGMVFAIERHCSSGTCSATYERNLIITESGAKDIFPVAASW